MPQVINTNVLSLTSQRNLNKTATDMATSLQRLSSGLRINSAKDDAAGLAISERMSAQINGLNQAVRNANDGISLAQTAEGAMGEMSNMLQRIRTLAVQSTNATNSSGDRQALQAEVGDLVSEINRIASSTEFNGRKILDGTFGAARFQVGANADETVTATTADLNTNQFGDHRVTGKSGTESTTAYRIAGETLTVSGAVGSKAITVAANDSAKKIAQAVNGITGSTGVEATAKTETTLAFTTAGSYQLTLKGDNTAAAVTISFSLSGTTTTSESLSSAISAVNDQTSKTGIVAEMDSTGTKVLLRHDTGENVEVGDTAFANAADVTVGAATLTANTTPQTAYVSGQVTFDSDKSFSVKGDAGETLTAATSASTLNSVADADVTTYDKANLAITIVDQALTKINTERAKFGAMQNRFDSVISNLSTTSENLAAARSRIKDTDFAAETASLTRSQILQQAGVAMLAQANAMPQSVLSLLG